MGMTLCDVTVTLKQQEKMETSFFLNRIHFYTRKYMFDIFTQKFPRVSQRPTLQRARESHDLNMDFAASNSFV